MSENDRLLTKEEMLSCLQGYISFNTPFLNDLRTIAKAQDAKNRDRDYEAGRKNMVEWIMNRLIDTGHLISVGTEEDTTVSLAFRSPLTLPEWQQLSEETRGNELGIKMLFRDLMDNGEMGA